MPPQNLQLPKEQIDQFLLFNRARKHVTVAPTAPPRNYYEQEVYFDDGVNVRIYTWINGTWRYSTQI